jgi:hypothetical protein
LPSLRTHGRQELKDADQIKERHGNTSAGTLDDILFDNENNG